MTALANRGRTRQAIESAMAALGAVLDPDQGRVTPATETRLQNAIDQLRKTGEAPELRLRFEGIAADLRAMANARVHGRTNLYASRLARLRRNLLH